MSKLNRNNDIYAGLDHIADIGDFEQEVWTYFGMGVNLQGGIARNVRLILMKYLT